MLVILMNDQLLPPQKICQGCVLADRSGQPRWRAGQLCCGHAVQNQSEQQPEQFECTMGFRVANIDFSG
ncbi:MAG TPA: hypothetical protein IGS53_06745 [Leptolyngbyaceae cyanobacterium M33_DOE_097]|uniref:Uncharacterized protein n=1 Tax=Oscillatoriales cyanobacterium SpSt-418 TaxID=2282169 RepID=A0A7C3PK20_9CYAN|nr:hypothetical protein [Leptolyngbyaceae cyanobacterium M33_DOE_097]